MINSFNDFYNNLSSNGLFFFWIVVFLFVFVIFLLVILLLKNRKLSKYLKENNISDTWESMNLNTFESYQKYLVDNGVRFIGIDTINADQTGGTEFPVHDLFSEKRLMIGENWAFFDQIDFERPYVIALPMKLIGCDGSPVRAIAVQWEEE